MKSTIKITMTLIAVTFLLNTGKAQIKKVDTFHPDSLTVHQPTKRITRKGTDIRHEIVSMNGRGEREVKNSKTAKPAKRITRKGTAVRHEAIEMNGRGEREVKKRSN